MKRVKESKTDPNSEAFLLRFFQNLRADRDVLDGVADGFEQSHLVVGDAAGFRARDELADLGMDGKSLIHPEQIAAANEIFAPAAAEVDWARRILAAFEEPENRGRGVIRLEGRMVERMHAEMAARTVEIAEAIEAAG